MLFPGGAFDGERLEVGADLTDLLLGQVLLPGRHLFARATILHGDDEFAVAQRELSQVGRILAKPGLAVGVRAMARRAELDEEAVPFSDRVSVAGERIGGSRPVGGRGRLNEFRFLMPHRAEGADRPSQLRSGQREEGGRETESPRGAQAECHVGIDRKSTRLNSSHPSISYAVFCLKKKKKATYGLIHQF